TTGALGGRTLAVKFAAAAEAVFEVTISDASLTIGDFVTIEGSVSFDGDTFAGTGLMVFLGRGPAKLGNGSLNPLAMGVLLSDARIGLVRMVGPAGTGYALVASGTVRIVGVPGVTIAGTTAVRVNTTGGPVDTTLQIPGSTDPGIPVVFTGPELAFTVSNATLAFAGYALTGTFGFSMVGADVKVTLSGAALALGGGLGVTDLDGFLVMTAAGLVADLDARLTIASLLPSPVDVAVAVDTRAGAATPLRIEVSDLTLTLAGQSLQVGSLVVQQSVLAGVTSTYLALAGVGLDLGGGAVRLVGGSGFLVLGTGVAGLLAGSLAVTIPGVSLQGTLGVVVNTTAAPVTASLLVAGQPTTLSLPGGPYLRVEGSGIVLDIMGQRLKGNVAFEQATTVPTGGGTGQVVLKVALTDVSLSLGGTSPVATLTGGTALFVSRATGLAGRISGSLALVVPGITLTGSLAVLVNTGSSAVAESFRVGDGDVLQLAVPAGGTLAAPSTYLAVTGTAVTLQVAGQSLQADFELELAGGATTVRLRNAAVRLGGTTAAPLLSVSQVAGTTGAFTLGATGLTGAIAVQLSFAVSGVAVSGQVAIELDTRPGSERLSVRGDDLKLAVFGQTIAADITFEQVANAAGAKLVRFGIADGALFLGGSQADGSDAVVSVTGITGLFLLTPAGVGGTLAGRVSLDVPAVEFAAAVSVSLNTTGQAISQTLVVGGAELSIALAAGPYLRIEAAAVVLRIAGQSLTGNVAIEQATTLATPTSAATTILRVGLTDVTVRIGDGTRTIAQLTGGSALLVLLGTGIAGRIQGSFALVGVPGVTLSATVAIELNKTAPALAVQHRFVIGGITTDLVLPAGDYLKVSATSVTIRIGGAVDLLTDFSLTQTGTGTGTVTTVHVARGSIALAGGLVKAINISGDFTLGSTGASGTLAAGLQVTVPGLAVSGNVAVTFDTTVPAPTFAIRVTVAQLVIGDAASPLLSVGAARIDIESVPVGTGSEIRFAVTDATLTIAGPSGPIVNVLASHHWSASLVVTSGGIAAAFSGALSDGTNQVLAIPGVELLPPGQFTIQLNTSATAIVRGAPFNLDIPAGPFVAVAMTGVGIRIGGTAGVQLTGDFLVTSSSTETLIAFSDVTLSLGRTGTSETFAISGAHGVFLVLGPTTPGGTDGGLAGAFTGKASLSGGGAADLDVEASIRFNGSRQLFSRIVTVGGTALTLSFTDAGTADPADDERALADGTPFTAYSMKVTIKLGDFIELSGEITGGSGVPLSVTNLSIFVGEGPGFLDNTGTKNPQARGIYITNAVGQAVKDGSGSYTSLLVRGDIAVQGIPGVVLSGRLDVRYNAGAATTLTIPGGTPTSIALPAGTTAVPYLLVVGSGITIDIAGQKLTGSVAVQRSGTGLRFAIGAAIDALDGNGTVDDYAPLAMSFGGGIAELSVATGFIELSAQGVVAVLDGRVTLSVGTAPDRLLHLDAPAKLQLNSTAAGQTALGFALPPRSVRVQVGSVGDVATLEVFGQRLTGVLVFSQVVGIAGPGSTTPPVSSQLVVTNLTLEVGARGTGGALTAGVRISDGSAFFSLSQVTPAGSSTPTPVVAGQVSGTLTLVGTPATVSGTILVAVNTGGVAVNESVVVDGRSIGLVLPAGPYLKVSGTDVQLGIAGQRLSGNLAITQTGAGAVSTLAVTFDNLQAGFGDGTTDFVRLVNGSGSLTLAPTGLTGEIGGTVQVLIPGVEISSGLTLVLGTNSVKLAATATTVRIGGFELAGQVEVSQLTNGLLKTTNIRFDVTASLGDPIGSVALAGDLTVTQAGMKGYLALTAGITIGDVSITADPLRLEIDTATGFVAITGEAMAVTIGTIALRGSFAIRRIPAGAGAMRTVVAVAGGSLTLVGTTPILRNINGLFVVVPPAVAGATTPAQAGGIAGQLSGTIDLSSLLPPEVGVSGGFALLVNRTGRRVTESVTLAGTTTTLDVAAGPYLKVAGTGITLTIMGQRLSGSVSFEQSGTTTRIVLQDVSLRLGDGATDLVVISTVGINEFTLGATAGPVPTRFLFGRLRVQVAVTVPGISLGGDQLWLEINTDATGGHALLDGTLLPANLLRIGGTGIHLEVAGQRLSGTFWIEQSGPVAARTTRISVSDLFVFLGDPGADRTAGESTLAAGFADNTGVAITGGTGSLLLTSAGLAAAVSGTIVVAGLDTSVIEIGALPVRLELNTMPTAVRDQALGLQLPAGRFLRLQLGTVVTAPDGTVALTPLSIRIAGQSFSGVFSFEQVASAGPDGRTGTTDDVSSIKIAATAVELFLGDDGGTTDLGDDIGLRISGGTALLLITPEGIAGRIAARASVSLGPGIGSAGADVTVTLNQLRRVVSATVVRPVAVNETFVIGGTTATLVLPAGVYLSAAITGLGLEIGGQRFTTDLGFERRLRLNPDGSIVLPEVATTTISFANLGLRLGTPDRDIVVVSGGQGSFVIVGASPGVAGGIVGVVSAQVAIDIPGVTFQGAFRVLLNTRPGTTGAYTVDMGTTTTADDVTVTPGLAVTGTGITLEIAGQRLTGGFGFSRSAAGDIVVLVQDARLALGDGTRTFVTVEVDGALLVTAPRPATPAGGGSPASPAVAGGLAGELTATLTLSPELSSQLGIEVALDLPVVLQVNTTTATVNRSFTIGTLTRTINVRANSLAVQVGLASRPATLALFGQSVTAVIRFEQSTTPSGAKVVKVGFTNLNLFLGDDNGTPAVTGDDVGLRLTGGYGVILITPSGYAGEFVGTVALAGLPVTVDVTRLSVQVNTLAVAVTETVTFVDAAGAGTTRTMVLPKGQFLRIAGTGVVIGFAGTPLTLTGSVAFERAGTGTNQVTRIGISNATLNPNGQAIEGSAPSGSLVALSGALFLFGAGAVTNPGGPGTADDIRTTTGGVAGLLTGRVQAGGGSATLGASLGFALNTTGAAVKQSIVVGSETLSVDLAANQRFAFVARDVEFSLGDFIEVRAGQIVLSGDVFTGTGLELFIGKGPSRLADGSANPDAIGVLIRNASVAIVRDPGGTGYALRARGEFAFIGLDGLQVSATVDFLVNTSSATLDPADLAAVAPLPASVDPILGNYFSFKAINVSIGVAGVFVISGNLSLTRQPNGDLDLAFNPIGIVIRIEGTNIALLQGYASFSIAAATGFRLNSFKVGSFKLFPSNADIPASVSQLTGGGTVAMFPTADLAGPYKGQVLRSGDPNYATNQIKVVFNDPNGVGLNVNTITDAEAELQVLVNGTAVALAGTGGNPVRQGTSNVWTYTLASPLPAGLVTVRFLPGTFADNSGATTMGEDEFFILWTPPAEAPAQTQPGPTAALASPANGGAITVAQINAQGYLDVTYTSLDGSPILKGTFNTTVPFKLTGTAVADLLVAATPGNEGRPTVRGTPLLITGKADSATSVTYRYYLQDRNKQNAIGLFQAGTVQLVFDGVFYSSGNGTAPTGAPGNLRSPGQTQSFRIDPSAPGETTTGGSVALGPLSLQGPSVGLADFGFADGMVVLTIALGVDRASLDFSPSATPAPGGTPAAGSSGASPSVELLGILGTFDLAVDVFGLLSGNFRVEPTGAWSLNVASLEAVIPDVATLRASGIAVKYDPSAARGQELVRINTAEITLPKFGITGSLRPYNPSTRANLDVGNDASLVTGVIPGLIVRDNGFTLGTAELKYKPGTPSTGGAAPSGGGTGKISICGIIELDDIRVGISGLAVNFDAANPVAGFTGEIYVATGGATLFPGRSFTARFTDRKTADDRRPDGTEDDEAFRVGLGFSGGAVTAFLLDVDTMEIVLGGYVTLTARDFELDTGAAGTDAELVSFASVGATVTIGDLRLTGEGRYFAVTGNGGFVTKPGFGVFLAVGSAGGGSFKWPAWLPIRIDAIGIEWANVQQNPGDFVLTLSATVTGIQGLSDLTFSGSVQGIRIQPSLLLEGKFPVIGIDAFGVTVSGKLFGGEINAGLVGGILRLDSNFQIIGTFDRTTPVAQRVFYLGIQGGFSIA
ncbi:MAG: hypothetical protein AAGC63_14885, partial [Propionicimonas sp.]